MASDIRLSDFIRWFERLGVTIVPSQSGHYLMKRILHGDAISYIFPTLKGRYVRHFYLSKARKALKLTKDDGVGDENFE